MKLFQQLLVASAAMSFFAPLAAQASDTINLDGIDSYSRKQSKSKRFDSSTFANEISEDIANLKGRIDGLEAKQNVLEAGSFSETTTLDGSLVFAASAIDGVNKVNALSSDTFQTMYTYTMNLNTSFTGDDNLYVRLRSGNGKVDAGNFYEKTAYYHTDTYSGSPDKLAVDKIWYTTPVGNSEKWTATIGPRIENYYMYAAPVSLYRPGYHKAFKLGSLSGAFGASTATGFGVKYQGDNGWAASTNIVSKGASSNSGLFTDLDESKWDTMVAYTKDQYHVSLTFSRQHDDWSSFSYYATDAAVTVTDDTNANAYAARAYWRPEESGTAVPEVSVGYDIISFGAQGNPATGDEATSYFVGLGWPDIIRDSDYFGIGFGQPLKISNARSGETAGDQDLNPLLWEASYSFKVNDSLTMIPAVFGGSDIQSATDQDLFFYLDFKFNSLEFELSC